jgi:hypothetical protein
METNTGRNLEIDFFMLPKDVRRRVFLGLDSDERRLFKDYFGRNKWHVDDGPEFKDLLLRMRQQGNEMLYCQKVETQIEGTPGGYLKFEREGKPVNKKIKEKVKKVKIESDKTSPEDIIDETVKFPESELPPVYGKKYKDQESVQEPPRI